MLLDETLSFLMNVKLKSDLNVNNLQKLNVLTNCKLKLPELFSSSLLTVYISYLLRIYTPKAKGVCLFTQKS